MTLNSKDNFVPMITGEKDTHGDAFIQRNVSRFNLKLDPEWSLRESRLHIYKLYLNSKIYNNLLPFHEEYTGSLDSGTYIRLVHRRPSVIYALPKIIVNESTSLLFGKSHFPTLKCNDDYEETEKFLQYITNNSNLKVSMLKAAKKGSLGSVCIIVKVLKKKFYFDVLDTKHLMPIFDNENPECLKSVRQYHKVNGNSLIMKGYDISKEDKNTIFYLEREWTDQREIYYKPYKYEESQEDYFSPKEDKERSSDHDFGFVPAVWIKNLPSEDDDDVDGVCTFEPILDNCIEMDYQLSQLGRLLRYNSDPTLVIKNPSALENQEIVKGLGALQLDEKGDAFLLELSNGATKSVLDYFNKVREISLEAIRGNRANPEKLSAAQSGKALQFLNNALIGLVEEMRLTYGELGLKKIYVMILDIFYSQKIDIDTGDFTPQTGDKIKSTISLNWPDWYPKTPQDNLQEAQALQSLTSSSNLSHETAVTSISEDYNIVDVNDEMKKIEKNNIIQYNMSDISNKTSGVDPLLKNVDRDKEKVNE